VPRLLVIDDDIDVRTLLELMFEGEGFTVITAADGLEGLRAARLARPCAIVLDLRMPRMDGWQFRREQRNDPSLADVPVIIATADPVVRRSEAELDAAAVMQKPLDFDELVGIVRVLCDTGVGGDMGAG
jgi:DNA-binding response OmpR family regulator